VDSIKTIETMTASADAANQAAEAALLASEEVVTLSSRVSDDVRSAVQKAIRAAAPPRVDPDTEGSSLQDHIPLIVSALTLCGVVYLTLQNDDLSQQLNEQIDIVSVLEEQVEGLAPTSLIMALAESGQRIEEALSATHSAMQPPTTTAVAVAQTTPAEEGSGEAVAAEGPLIAEAVPQAEPLSIEPPPITSSQITSRLEQISQQLVTLQATLTALPATPAATPAVASNIGITIESIRATLQQELTPLQQSLTSMESGIQQQFSELQLQPALPQASVEITTPYRAPATVLDNSKPRPYRFP
jgi:hypothetical protein